MIYAPNELLPCRAKVAQRRTETCTCFKELRHIHIRKIHTYALYAAPKLRVANTYGAFNGVVQLRHIERLCSTRPSVEHAHIYSNTYVSIVWYVMCIHMQTLPSCLCGCVCVNLIEYFTPTSISICIYILEYSIYEH